MSCAGEWQGLKIRLETLLCFPSGFLGEGHSQQCTEHEHPHLKLVGPAEVQFCCWLALVCRKMGEAHVELCPLDMLWNKQGRYCNPNCFSVRWAEVTKMHPLWALHSWNHFLAEFVGKKCGHGSCQFLQMLFITIPGRREFVPYRRGRTQLQNASQYLSFHREHAMKKMILVMHVLWWLHSVLGQYL